jgi:hypothetical protein
MKSKYAIIYLNKDNEEVGRREIKDSEISSHLHPGVGTFNIDVTDAPLDAVYWDIIGIEGTEDPITPAEFNQQLALKSRLN